MSEIITVQDLENLKKHEIFEAEVITGKVGGLATGADISSATNQVTGQIQDTLPKILSDLGMQVQSWPASVGGTLTSPSQVFLNDIVGSIGNGDYYAWAGSFPKTVAPGTDPALPGSGYVKRSDKSVKVAAREAIRRSYAESGHALVAGSFETGGVLASAIDVLLHEASGKAYSGAGPFPQTVPAGTNPAVGGFVDKSAELLRTEFLRRDGDIQGWGAKCDGVTYDDAAISAAIVATGGRITIRNPTKVSTHIIFTGLQAPKITFEGNGKVSTDSAFVFHPAYRGILVFDACNNPTSLNPVIVGARVDKLSAAEPWEDGDSGVEYINCTGKCLTVMPILSDFKAWGVIHINVEDYEVVSPTIKNCLVQSGIGGTGVNSAIVSDPDISYIGLYGVEIETTGSNKRTRVSGGRVRKCLKGVAVVGSEKVDCDTTVEDCTTGFSGTHPSAKSCLFNGIARNCFVSWESVNTSACTFSVTEKRDAVGPTAFYKFRSYDYIHKVVSGTAYTLDRDGARASLTVGNVIQLDDGTTKTVASVLAEVIDPVFGRLLPFTTSPAMTNADSRKGFFRENTLAGNTKYGLIYDGDGLDVVNGESENSAIAYVSFGNHSNMKIRNMSYRNVGVMFDGSLAGTLTNCRVQLNEGDSNLISGMGPVAAKFAPAMSSVKALNLPLSGTHRVVCGIGYISKIEVILNDDVTWGGTPLIRVNGADTITAFPGVAPKYGVGSLNVSVNSNSGVNVQFLSTGTAPAGTGYGIRLHGLFIS